MENFSCDMGWGRSGSRWSFRAGLTVLAAILFCADLAAEHGDAAAQPAGLAMPPAGLDAVPSARHLAAALSDQDSRGDTLLTVATVARLLEYGRHADAERAVEIEARFRAERAWLDRLAARSAELPWRPSLLDPPAWFLLRELDHHGVAPGLLVSPVGPDDQTLLRQVFDQADEHLAAALLPELLPRMEMQSTGIWRQLLNLLPADPALAAVVLGLQADWFDPWIAAEPQAPAGGDSDLLLGRTKGRGTRTRS